MSKYIKLASLVLFLMTIPVLATYAQGFFAVTANASASRTSDTSVGTCIGSAITQAGATVTSDLTLISAGTNDLIQITGISKTCYKAQGPFSCTRSWTHHAPSGYSWVSTNVECDVFGVDDFDETDFDSDDASA